MISFKEFLLEAKDPHAKVVSKLEDLSKKISKYAHRWGDNPSQRLMGWVDEYNDLKLQHRDSAWRTYCDKNKFSYSHDAYDCLA